MLSTEMDVLRGSARKSRLEKNNDNIKEIMGVKGKPDIIEKKRLQWYGHVKRMPEQRIPKLILEWVPEERRKRGRPRKTWMDGRSTSSHDSEKFRARSMEKQRGMAFGFRKTATAVIEPDLKKPTKEQHIYINNILRVYILSTPGPRIEPR
jgi:hypothetical protein